MNGIDDSETPTVSVTADAFREAARKAGWQDETVDLLLKPLPVREVTTAMLNGVPTQVSVWRTERFRKPVAMGDPNTGGRRKYVVID